MNLTISFSKNWNNKLDNQFFTTIRLYNKEKFDYYLLNIDKIFDVKLNGHNYSQVKLLKVEKFKFSDIPNGLKIIDAGPNYKDIFSKFDVNDSSDIIILTFETINIK